MTIRRLIDEPVDEFESALLSSMRLDVPDERTVLRGVLAVTAAAGTMTATSAALGATGSAAGSTGSVAGAASGLAGAASHAAAPHAVAGLGLAAKWLGIGIVAGVVATGTGAYVTTPRAAPPRTETETTTALSPPSPGRQGRAAERTASAVAPERPADDLPAPPADDPAHAVERPHSIAERSIVAAPAAGVAGAAGAIGAAGAAGPDLSIELAALSRARLALSSRNPARALRELQAYEATRRSDVLDEEARVIRIEALLQAGERKLAAELAREHLEAHPRSAHRARLREITEQQNP